MHSKHRHEDCKPSSTGALILQVAAVEVASSLPVQLGTGALLSAGREAGSQQGSELPPTRHYLTDGTFLM